MKAVTLNNFDGPDSIQIQDMPVPQITDDEVLLDVKAASLNHLDIWVTMGRHGPNVTPPHIAGADGAGIVAAVGSRVKNITVGQEVLVNPGLSCNNCRFCNAGNHSVCNDFGIMGFSRPGTFAEKVAVPAVNIYPKPPHLDFAAAAALPLDHVTAWRMLITRCQIQPGDTVLIHGIGGGAALAGLQIARTTGARVIATSSSDQKLTKAQSMGAAHLINYKTSPDVAQEVLDFTDGAGVDFAFDSVGAETWPINEKVLRRGGTVVTCGVTTGPTTTVSLQRIYWNQLTILGSTMGSQEDFRAMITAVDINKITPVIDSTFPLDQAPAAYQRMHQAQQFGKIILKNKKGRAATPSFRI
ncbi:MAG: zinc-binding dehydrogenase [Planctomycetes bacterium]|nr:zinc-binding dehydrogenase [Planctomycetota bacterium]